MYFVTGLSYALQQASTAGLAKTKADIPKKSSYSYSSHLGYLTVNNILPLEPFYLVTHFKGFK